MLHQLALHARATVLSPFRRARLQSLARAGEAPASVLFYHRVADNVPNSWTITCAGFEKHVDYCCERMELVGLPWIQEREPRIGSGMPPVSFTFDDGYDDNCDFAITLLIERGIPCTYFVTTLHIRQQIPFPHDEKRPLPVNTVAQLRQMSEAGIEIGCHTRSHVDFSQRITPEQIRHEIIDAKDELEQMIGTEVRYFAFPYGMPAQLTSDALAAVQQAGFKGFCSAYGSYNLPDQDPFHIRRCHGDPEYARFLNWLSFDRSKLRDEPTIHYPQPVPQETRSQHGRQTVPIVPQAADSTLGAPVVPTIDAARESCG